MASQLAPASSHPEPTCVNYPAAALVDGSSNHLTIPRFQDRDM